MVTFEEEAAVDFVGQYQDVPVPDDFRNLLNIFTLHHTAGRVVRGIQDDQFRAVGDEGCQFIDVEGEITLLAQVDRNGFSTDIVDHRFVDGEAGVGIYNL